MDFVPCPYCTTNVKSRRLPKHIAQVHPELANATDEAKRLAEESATELRARPKPPESPIAKLNRFRCSPAYRSLPLMIRKNYPNRQRLYLAIYETGIVTSELSSLPVAFSQCYLCGRWKTQPQYRVPLKDDTYVDLAQDCFDALLGINENNVGVLRELLALESGKSPA